MQLRLVASRVIQCLPRYQPMITVQSNFQRCICTVQHNLKPTTTNISSVYHLQYRFKRTGVKHSKPQDESDSESDEEDKKNDKKPKSNEQTHEVEPGGKIITYKLDSPRIDRLLRRVLNISGKNVEDLFYSKKIQLNGKVLVKKGQKVDEGDIITLPLEDPVGKTARGALIEVLEIIENENNCSVKVSRNKSTLVSV